MYWIAGAALNRLNTARNARKKIEAKHILQFNVYRITPFLSHAKASGRDIAYK